MDINDLIRDESFKAKIKSAKSLDEVAELLSANGFEVKASDIESALAQSTLDELGEDELENVAGGSLRLFKYILPVLPLIPMPIIPGRFKR